MRLLEKQNLFARLLPLLISKALDMGFEISCGDLYRDPRVHGPMGVKMGYSSANSCHKLRLAIDLNLFRGGQYVISTEGHRELGEWWEAQHPLCRWGGRWEDGNHYSLEHDGYK